MISSDGCRTALQGLDAEIISFENVHFGLYYSQGNKIECLKQLPENETFFYFDNIYKNILLIKF